MEWLNYICKVSACMGLFYAFFHLFLRKLTFFQMNRAYLLATILISFSVPLFQIEVESNVITGPQVHNQVARRVTPSNTSEIYTIKPITPSTNIDMTWEQIIPALYWLITLGLFGSVIMQLLKLAKHARKISSKQGRLKVIYKKTGFTNCSFLNYVFLDPEKLSEAELAILLRHEQVHASQLHTIDKLLFSLAKSLLWFNPFIYLYDRALEHVHEYEADKKASDAIGTSPYAGLLLNIASRQSGPSLTHSFAGNPIKERIQMLLTNQSRVMKKSLYLSSLPLVGVLIWAFAVQIVSASPQTQNALSPAKLSSIESKPIQEEPIVVEESEQETAEIKPQTSDTLWMIRPGNYGPNTKVIIDGTKYNVEILTKISPRCIKTTSISTDSVEITTHDNKIIYANEIDRENLITERKALYTDKVYVRFRQKNQDGSPFDYVYLITAEGRSIAISLPLGSKLLLLIDGKQYSEAMATNLTRSDFPGRYHMTASGVSPELQVKYGNDYHGLIHVNKENKIDKDSVEVERFWQIQEKSNKNDSSVVSKQSGPDTSIMGKRTHYRGTITQNPSIPQLL